LSFDISKNYSSMEYLPLESDGHYHIQIPTFYEFDNYSNDNIDFIFDTGAFLTVITRKMARFFGFVEAYTIKKDISLTGFAGGCLADLKELPGFVIGGRILSGVKVAVPHDETDINILGLNVIEYFRYYIDTENDYVYFAPNRNVAIAQELQCKSINVISSDL
jgi:predicted aspartyl protease